ncbi:MAG: septal ring lytic transglycosylase RlpA family protein [Nitrospira sp.]|nr:septal ring lytic transglycosylase RlpA family protein [Nitrospira sp.]MCP9462784.1 septal ring lytic transglycosylase RlpA family protein [Nitrospira sp.]MCP9475837.1 septal ring lytic transglycosylase RlpA family protein [Nitrospira sp.]
MGRSLMQTILAFGALSCFSVGACSWMPTGESLLDVGIKERGAASWYGAQFHGKVTASGERFDMDAFTAAHRTLPLGSMVRVVNLANGKHTRVRITDRGPYVNGRILDLSYAAAVQLGMVEAGLSVIQLEVVGDRRPDFVLDAEERAWRVPPLLRPSRTDEPLRPVESTPVVRRSRSQDTLPHPFPPHDLLVQRRWTEGAWGGAADPAYRTATALLL